jgi:hypothetical protein
VIELVRRCRVTLAGIDVALLTVADAAVLVSELARLEKACASAKARAAERAAMRAEELAKVSGSSVGAAKAALDTAGLLAACPDTAAALAAGEVSLDQAHEITRTEKEAPGSEGELLQLARSSGLKTLKEQARKRRHHAAGIENVHRRQVAARAFRHWKNDLGNIAFCGELPPETGVPFVNRLEAECDRVRRDAKRTTSNLEERDAYRADAFVRMFNDSGGRRAPSTELVIVADYRAWRRGTANEDEPCHVIGGGDIPVEVAKALADDALLRVVIHDGVNPLRVKHFNRYIPAELKTVLKIGPPPTFEGLVCVDDGCERQAHLQLDHVDPVANWGPTSYQNLKPRCWHHHQEKTERDRRAGLLDGRARTGGPSP